MRGPLTRSKIRSTSCLEEYHEGDEGRLKFEGSVKLIAVLVENLTGISKVDELAVVAKEVKIWSWCGVLVVEDDEEEDDDDEDDGACGS
jgi:hypothetical protein